MPPITVRQQIQSLDAELARMVNVRDYMYAQAAESIVIADTAKLRIADLLDERCALTGTP